MSSPKAVVEISPVRLAGLNSNGHMENILTIISMLFNVC